MNVLLEAPLSKKKLVQSKLARGEKKEEIKPVPVRCVDGAECRNNGVGAECGKSCYQSRGREICYQCHVYDEILPTQARENI